MLKKMVLATIFMVVPAITYAETLRFATLNCEFLNTKKVHIKYGEKFNFDGWDEATRTAKFEEASEAIAKEIQAINAHVIVLTEVGNESDVDILLQYLDYDYHAVCKSTDTTTGQHVAILSRFALSDVLKEIPGREFYDTEADDVDGEKDTGLSKGMRVTFEFSGQKIYVYGVHLKSERGYSEADGQRIAQASIVRRHYLPLLQNGENVIVAGDLNDKRGDPTLRRIRGRDDLWGDLIQTGVDKYWQQVGERWTYQYKGDRNQIDHILPSYSLRKDINASVHKTTEMLEGYPVTDHRGLIVEFDL